MLTRMRANIPLALAVAILTFLWVDLAANFDFHWFTNGELGNGLSLPGSFHLVLPAAFISWAMFFAAGGTNTALAQAASSSVIGAVGGLALMFLVPRTAELPDFWAIALIAAIIAFAVVVLGALGEWYFVPGIVAAFATTLLWWMATGMDGWAPGGGGVGNSVEALGDAATAGTGAFGGVISTPYGWVFVNTAVSMLAGTLLGAVSVRLAAVLSFTGAAEEAPQDINA